MSEQLAHGCYPMEYSGNTLESNRVPENRTENSDINYWCTVTAIIRLVLVTGTILRRLHR